MLSFQDQRLVVKSTIFPDGSNSPHEIHHSTNCHTIYLQLPLKNQRKEKQIVCLHPGDKPNDDGSHVSVRLHNQLSNLFFESSSITFIQPCFSLWFYVSCLLIQASDLAPVVGVYPAPRAHSEWHVWFISLCCFLISGFLLRGFCLLSVCFSTLLFHAVICSSVPGGRFVLPDLHCYILNLWPFYLL